MSDSAETQEIKVGVLALIRREISPISSKVESLLRAHYTEEYLLCRADLTSLQEINISSMLVDSYLGELIDQAEESNVSTLFLTSKEILLISTLAKSVASSVSLPAQGGFNLLDH